MNLLNRVVATVAALATSVFALLGCDQQKIDTLEEGLSTEIDVRKAFGEPETIWPEPDGSRTFEYPRQPMGHRNYMITIGSDGVMTALRQVLTPHVFEQIQPGMTQEQVRRMLGKPAQRMTYQLKQETDWDWNWIDPPSQEMEFTVTFGANGTVKKSGSRIKLPQGDR
ncbi:MULTISPECIES: outer membrane protein assembly factor BamE domain-containing protein [Comamonas]|uniref:outer membrane protein assembly factor BamE domain-containing protein n=1 Tax=Comamonas TaxID=283 RepID=UPI00257B7AC1|nr:MULTISPECIES: outer membrane protein assembly factor BamE [Comamonas]